MPVDLPPQAAPVTLSVVEARGARLPATVVLPLKDARKRLDERAGGTGIVDGDAYRDRRVGTLADALGYAAGVFVQPRFGAEESRLSIRGSGLQRTFHGRGIVLLQDGIPLNLADGSFDFQAVEPLAARYIEVWRGGNALEFGSATLGGAINLVSPTGLDVAPLLARVEAGSFGNRRNQVALAGSGASADAYASATWSRQDGFRSHATQQNRRLIANAGWQFSGRLDARAYLNHVDSRSALPGNLTLAEARADPRLAAPANVALDQRRDYRLDRVAGKLAWSPVHGQEIGLSLSWAGKDLHHPIFQVLEQASRDVGMALHWRSEGMVAGRRNVFVAGLSASRGRVDDDRFANEGGHAGARVNHFDQRAGNTALYAEEQFWISSRWVLALGAQALRATRRSRDLRASGARDQGFDLDYRAASPKLGLRFVAGPRLQAFANISRSAEPPSFGELNGGPGVTPVAMQRATSGEAGLRIQSPSLTLDAAVYRTRIEGELLALSDAEGNPRGTVNASRTRHDGIELGLQWRPSPRWRLSTNYLYNDFRFDGDPVYHDNMLAGVAPQQLRAALCWNCGGRLHLEPELDWAPQRTFVDHANSLAAPGHALVNLRIGGKLDARWDWFADLRNLAGRRWIAGTGVVADARGADSRNFLPGDGRAVYLGVEWRPVTP